MSYLEQIKDLGLEIMTRAEFFKLSLEEGWGYCKTVTRWKNISKGHPFCFIKRSFDSFYSLDFLLENGFIEPKDYNIENYLENRCTEYFVDKFEHREVIKNEKI